MRLGPYRFNRMELAGSLGDLGTLVPLMVTLVALGRVDAFTTFLLVGLFYVFSGLYYRIPIPIQPLKAMAAIAIGTQIAPSTMRAAALTMGGILLLLARMDLIKWMAGIFSKPIIRGIQLGIGLILMAKGISFLTSARLFWHGMDYVLRVGGMDLPLNGVLGLLGIGCVVVLRRNSRWPASIVLLSVGVGFGLLLGGTQGPGAVRWTVSMPPALFPMLVDFRDAFILLVIPQLPLTLGNSVFAASDTAHTLFGGHARRATPRALATTIGVSDVIAGLLGGMPICHGSGGIGAHYRFGARTGGALIMLGGLLILLTIAGGSGMAFLLHRIPLWVFGVLLFFSGIQMAVLVRDMESRMDVCVAILIGGVALVTKNMTIALGVGMVAYWGVQRGLGWIFASR